jgi:hypothetical protein
MDIPTPMKMEQAWLAYTLWLLLPLSPPLLLLLMMMMMMMTIDLLVTIFT